MLLLVLVLMLVSSVCLVENVLCNEYFYFSGFVILGLIKSGNEDLGFYCD